MLKRTIWIFRYPMFMLLLLWANINSGYWQLREFHTPLEHMHAFRAFVPYILLPLALVMYRPRPRIGGRDNPVVWLEAYGWFAFFASFLSPMPQAAFYFGAAFLANIYIPQFMLCNWREERGERVLIYLTWIVMVAYTIGILSVTRGSLLSLGYSISGAYKGGVEGMAMSRSSGIARFFGVCGLIAFARLWCGEKKIRLLWLAPIALCALVVWSMQSRGAMLGFCMGVVFVVLASRSSKWLYILLALGLTVVFMSEIEGTIIHKVITQMERGQDSEDLLSMSGRTKSYQIGFKVISENLFIGQGNWADRLSGAGHVHNSFLQALMNSGIIGFIPYMMSWVVGWRLFWRLSSLRDKMEEQDKQLFMETAVVMMFFTVRSIPETTTASFSIDSMVMVSVYLYLAVLYQRLLEKEEEAE